jgi:hypothetical protein
MTKYTIVRETTLENLINTVTTMLAEGYRPLGAPQIPANYPGTAQYFFQAMTIEFNDHGDIVR